MRRLQGEHLFTQINASKHIWVHGHPQGGAVPLCARWKGQTLSPPETETRPWVGCFTLINSALCVAKLGKLRISSENGIVKLSKLNLCALRNTCSGAECAARIFMKAASHPGVFSRWDRDHFPLLSASLLVVWPLDVKLMDGFAWIFFFFFLPVNDLLFLEVI